MPEENKTERGQSERDDLVEIKTSLKYIAKELDDIYGRLEKNYVTFDQFSPVRAIAYGLMGATGFALLAAILGFVIKKPV
jgi:hypothetical protein